MQLTRTKFLIHLLGAVVAAVLLMGSQNAQAADSCVDVFSANSTEGGDAFPPEIVKGSWRERRMAVVDFLKANPSIPAYMKKTKNGDVPVILVNKKTHALLRPLLESSVGYGFEQRPDHVDHGILRVQDAMIDFGHMNTRQGPANTELYRTGIAWKNLKEVLPWRRVVIQQSYLMPPRDLDTVRYYQLVRRASLFRTKFFFSEDRFLDRKKPNLLEKVVEDCFDFCKTDKAGEIVREIDARLKRLSGAPPDTLVADERVRLFTKAARLQFLNADSSNPTDLSWSALQDLAVKYEIPGLLDANASVRKREAFANLLASRDAIVRYASVLKRYKITPDDGYADLHRPPVSFVLVLDDPSRARDFRSAQYTTMGKWFHWTPEDQSRLKRPR